MICSDICRAAQRHNGSVTVLAHICTGTLRTGLTPPTCTPEYRRPATAPYSTLEYHRVPQEAGCSTVQCGSVRGACSASLGMLRDALVDAPFLPVRRQPRADAARTADAVGPLGPGADVERSWRRCGGSQSQLSFGSPGADVGKSRCSPVQLAAVARMQAACERERCSVGLHVPIAQRMSFAVAPTNAQVSSHSRARRRRPRRYAASARCTTPSQPMPPTATSRISHGSPAPSAVASRRAPDAPHAPDSERRTAAGLCASITLLHSPCRFAFPPQNPPVYPGCTLIPTYLNRVVVLRILRKSPTYSRLQEKRFLPFPSMRSSERPPSATALDSLCHWQLAHINLGRAYLRRRTCVPSCTHA